MSLARCPDCGRVVSPHFPLHNCIPTENKKRELAAKAAKKAKAKPATFCALILVYEPFIMGGDVWQPRRYETEGTPVRVGKYRCFTFFNDVSKKHHVHDQKTGGLLGEGRTVEEAVATAKKNIAETPDLDAQMRSAGSVEGPKVITKDEALRRG